MCFVEISTTVKLTLVKNLGTALFKTDEIVFFFSLAACLLYVIGPSACWELYSFDLVAFTTKKRGNYAFFLYLLKICPVNMRTY